MSRAVLVELDYKGDYSRFALTPDEFKERFIEMRPEIPEPIIGGDTFTLRPLVHIWYCLTEVGDSLWNVFFTDMTWGLPETDIRYNNRAYIDFGEFVTLSNEVMFTIKDV